MKEKIKEDLIKITNFCSVKDTENENTDHRQGENICKIDVWWRAFIQNIHRTLKTQQKNQIF